MVRQRANNTDYIDPIIIQSAQQGHMLLLEFMHSIGVNIHQASSVTYPSPLHAAIVNNKLQVVRWLIKHGADCNTRNRDGQTALQYAVTEGSLDVLRALLQERGASLEVLDDYGDSH
jgi:ankyrin repeat protein